MEGLKVKEFLAREGERLGIRTQEELAEALGVTDQTVSNWSNAVTFPPHKTEYRLLLMGMTIEELFGPEIWERSEEAFDRKTDFFMQKLFDKIDKLEPRG